MAAIVNGVTKPTTTVKYGMPQRFTYAAATATVNGVSKPILGKGTARA